MSKKIFFLLVALVAVLWLAGFASADEADTLAPSAIIDLAASNITQSSVTLSWTAPGDDGPVGTSTSYDLRYATSTITETNWASVTQASGEPTPKIASSSQSMVVSGLASSTTYYFAIKANDEVNNTSTLSNVVSATTLAPPAPVTPAAELTFEMKVTPSTLNLTSQGQWMTVHLFLSAPYKARDVDFASLKLNDTFSPDARFRGFDNFKIGKQDKGKSSSILVLKFPRSNVESLISSIAGNLTLTLTGKVNGKTFSASDTILVRQQPCFLEGSLIRATSSPEVYIIKNCRKRHIPSPEAFNRLRLRWENIKEVLLEELNAYLEEELLKASDGPEVYIIIGGMKRHVPSPEVFAAYGFNWNDISIISRAELNDYPDIQLIRAAGDTKVYLLVGGKRHWIPSLAIFNKHGYKWDNVVIVNASECNAILEGEKVE